MRRRRNRDEYIFDHRLIIAGVLWVSFSCSAAWCRSITQNGVLSSDEWTSGKPFVDGVTTCADHELECIGSDRARCMAVLSIEYFASQSTSSSQAQSIVFDKQEVRRGDNCEDITTDSE